MSKHTPGPWWMPSESALCAFSGHPPGAVHVFEASWNKLQRVGQGVEDWEEAHANARLIAAAPDLLDLANQISEYDADHIDPQMELARLRRAACALLARIDGD